MTVARGFGLTFGFGQEVTWGTPVARTVWMRGISSTLEDRITREKSPTLGSIGAVSTSFLRQFDRAREAGGTIEGLLSYNDATQLVLRHMFGAVTDGGSTGAYTHTYTLAVPPPAGLTIEEIKGTHASLDMAKVYDGGRFNSWQIVAEAGRPVQWSGDIIAQTSGGPAAAGSPSYTTGGAPVLHHHLSTGLTFDGEEMKTRRLVLSVNRNLSRNQELGSLLTSEPIDGRIEISLEAEVLWQSNKPYTAHYAGTQGDATWTFTSGSLSAAFTLHNAVVQEVDAPTQEAGGIVQRFRLEGFSDGSDQGLALVITNANQLYSAN